MSPVILSFCLKRSIMLSPDVVYNQIQTGLKQVLTPKLATTAQLTVSGIRNQRSYVLSTPAGLGRYSAFVFLQTDGTFEIIYTDYGYKRLGPARSEGGQHVKDQPTLIAALSDFLLYGTLPAAVAA